MNRANADLIGAAIMTQAFWKLTIQRQEIIFKSTKKLDRNILDLLDISLTPGHCGDLLPNPHNALSGDFLPILNPVKILILLCISFDNLKFVCSILVRKLKTS